MSKATFDKSQRIDVVWAENRDEIFMNRLAEDIGRFQAVGFDNKTILKMIGMLDYVRFWAAWPRWMFPADKLPKGYKWTDGVKYNQKPRKRGRAETYTFLAIGDDLYIRYGTDEPTMPGINKNDRMFLRVLNWRNLTASEFLGQQNGDHFYNTCVRRFWQDNGLSQGIVRILRNWEHEKED